MKVQTERIEYFGRLYPVFVSEFGGAEYRFDPVRRAMEKASIKEPSEGDIKAAFRDILGYIKTGRHRACIGAVCRFALERTVGGEPVCPALLPLILLGI